MVIVPVRVLSVVLSSTAKPTVPSPDPLAPAVTVIQLALLTAVHEQPFSVVTPTVPVEDDSGNETLGADNVNVHAAPACVTVYVCPATVIEPVRVAGVPLAVKE